GCQQGAGLRQPGLALEEPGTQRYRRSVAEIPGRQRRPYRARADCDPAHTLFGPYTAANPRHGCDRYIQRIRFPRTSDAATLERSARDGRTHPYRCARSLGRGFVNPGATSAAGVADQAPFSWQAANGQPRSWAQPSDSPAADPIFPGTAPASYYIASASVAS